MSVREGEKRRKKLKEAQLREMLLEKGKKFPHTNLTNAHASNILPNGIK